MVYQAKSRICILAGILSSSMLTPAHAQGQAPSNGSGDGLDEIVVTAQRRETNLQDTPIAVTALSSEAMDARGVKNVGNIENFAPNVQINQGRSDGGGSNAQITIRGIGQNDPQFPNDPGVGLYVDGVYSARSYGGLIGLVDVERIEVLRGPQGTLFGRNTIGGAVNIVTKPPEQEFSGKVSLLYGSFDRFEAKASLNVPLIEDKLAARFSAGFTRADGLGKQIDTGVPLSNENRKVFRAAFRATPSDDVTIDFIADYTRQRQNSAAATAVEVVVPSTSGLIEGIFNPFIVPQVNASLGLPANAVFDGRYVSGTRYDNYGRAPALDNLDSGGASLAVEWDATESLTFKSITAARAYKAHIAVSGLIPYTLVDTNDRQDQEQYSQELQAYGDLFGGRVHYLVGLYYFKELAHDANDVRILPGTLTLLPPFIPPFEISQSADLGLDATNYAAFGQFDVKIVENLSLTVGVRLNHEHKRFTRKFTHIEGGDIFIPYEVLEKSWNSFTPRFGIDWKAADNILVYGSYAEGFKGGGWNPRPAGQNLGVAPFEPETIKTYEVGAKTEWFNRRLTVNVAGFISDYDNIQLPVILPPFTIETQNAGRSRNHGIEVELSARPVPEATIQIGYGYFHNEYRSIAPGPAATTFMLTDKLPDAPEHTLNIGADYRFELGATGSLTVRGDGSYRSAAFKDAVNTPQIGQPAFWLVSGRITWASEDKRFRVQVYGNNLFDEKYLVAGLDASVVGLIFGYYGRPREFGVQATYEF